MISTKQYKNILDLVLAFPTEVSCHQYIASQKWSDGVVECPHCSHDRVYVFADQIRYKCAKCQKQFTAKTGTFMEASKLPTIRWFIAMYLIMHKRGISSVQLGKDAGVTQKTAWFMLHRVRFALGNQVEQELSGVIQLDETFVGGKNKNRHADKKVEKCQGRSFKDKTPVMGMLQQEIKTIVERPHKVIPGKIVKKKVILQPSVLRCRVIADTKVGSLQPIIRANVAAGSTLVSDEWGAYNGLNDIYNHKVVDHWAKTYVTEEGYTSNALECSWKSLKCSIIGIYTKVSSKHLNKYVNEFVFRQNNRNLAIQGQMEIMIKNMNCRLKYKQLIAA